MCILNILKYGNLQHLIIQDFLDMLEFCEWCLCRFGGECVH